MFESKGLIMWFTNYRAWKYEYESDCVRVVLIECEVLGHDTIMLSYF